LASSLRVSDSSAAILSVVVDDKTGVEEGWAKRRGKDVKKTYVV
jgi:hypothetical protein